MRWRWWRMRPRAMSFSSPAHFTWWPRHANSCCYDWGEAMSLLRSWLFSFPLIVLSTIVMGTISLIDSFFDTTGNSQHRLARIWAQILLAVSFIRARAEGLEK